MKLSTIISDYRNHMQISQREFARRCDLSNSYISFLEKETNPKTGKPMVPTIEQYKKLADGMDMSLQSLFELLDEDSPVDLHAPVIMAESSAPKTLEARIVSGGMDKLPQEQREQILNVVRAMFTQHPELFDNEDDKK